MGFIFWLQIVYRANILNLEVVAFDFTAWKEDNFWRAGKTLSLFPSVLAKVRMSSVTLYEAPLPAFITEYRSKSPISLKRKEISSCSCKKRCRESPVNVKELGEHTFYSCRTPKERLKYLINMALSKVQTNLVNWSLLWIFNTNFQDF